MTDKQKLAKMAKEIRELKAQLNKKATMIGNTSLDWTERRDQVDIEIVLGWNEELDLDSEYKEEITEALIDAIRNCLQKFERKHPIPHF